MDRAKVKALQKAVLQWKRYQEPPAKIAAMVADQVIDSITEFRQKNVKYLQGQIDNIHILQQAMQAKCTAIDPAVTAASTLKYGAADLVTLKKIRPKDYQDALIIAKELRSRTGAEREANAVFGKAQEFSRSYLYDKDFQQILADGMARESSLLIPSMLPTGPVEEITRQSLKSNKNSFIPVDDIIREICENDTGLVTAISAKVKQSLGESHLPRELREQYSELSKLQVKTLPNLDDAMQGWDESRKEEFLKSLPPETIEKYKNPVPAPAPVADIPKDPAHEDVIGDFARDIIKERKDEIAKELADLKGSAG